MRSQFQHLLLCRLVDVGITVEFIGRYRPHAALRMDVVLGLFFGKHFHAATGVADDHDFLHAQNMNRKHERTHNVFRCRRSDVPDNVRIGRFDVQPFEQVIQAWVHTGEDGDLRAGLFASEGS